MKEAHGPAGIGAVAAGLAALAVLLLIALGIWQLERRVGKLALIAQVERRMAAAPVALPGPATWPGISGKDAYTRLRAHGRFVAGHDSYVQAVTDYGGGFWLVTPLRTDAGWIVLVNRGFVPAELRGRMPPPSRAPLTITGLLRLTEPGGAFLRSNDPAARRWYSRDVAAVAARERLGRHAPFFLDADRSIKGWPRGGLTVVRFPNNHLSYAFTWFALAGLIAFMALRARQRRPA